MVVAPCAVGVNVAVYTVELDALNALNEPLSTEISPTTKFVVASLEVKVSANVPSFEVPPSDTSAAVIAIVGAVPS